MRTPVLPEEDESSDDEVGPKLSDFVDSSAAPEKSAAELFREREARMAAAPKAEEKKVTQRDEWMLAPPTGGSLASLDPRKRPTTFQKSAKGDTDLDGQREWTETPAEREQRLREGGPSRPKPEEFDRKRARERDDAIRQGVQQHAVSEPSPLAALCLRALTVTHLLERKLVLEIHRGCPRFRDRNSSARACRPVPNYARMHGSHGTGAADFGLL